MSASVSLPDAAAAQQCMGDGCLVTLGTKKECMNSGSIGMAKFSLLELVHPQQGETFQPGHPTNIKKWFSNSSAVEDYLDVFSLFSC